MEDVDVLVDIFKDILGKPRHHYKSKSQISFDCPVCSEEKGLPNGDGKGNLEINYLKHVYKCWACTDTNGTHGPLGKLIDIYGSKKHKRLYNLIRPDEYVSEKSEKTQLLLPEGFVRFKDSNPILIHHKEAYRYLVSRGVTDNMIDKFNIGYTITGDFAYRIIVPSYDIDGNLNYFIGRTWLKNKIKYKNPSVSKDEIIFNEKSIDWDKPIYLVEGVFDGFFLDNSLVMLGKKMSNLILTTLYTKAKNNIVICTDGDAWNDGLRIYNELNGGLLYNRVKIVKLPKDKDICDLRGNIENYYYEIK